MSLVFETALILWHLCIKCTRLTCMFCPKTLKSQSSVIPTPRSRADCLLPLLSTWRISYITESKHLCLLESRSCLPCFFQNNTSKIMIQSAKLHTWCNNFIKEYSPRLWSYLYYTFHTYCLLVGLWHFLFLPYAATATAMTGNRFRKLLYYILCIAVKKCVSSFFTHNAQQSSQLILVEAAGE